MLREELLQKKKELDQAKQLALTEYKKNLQKNAQRILELGREGLEEKLVKNGLLYFPLELNEKQRLNIEEVFPYVSEKAIEEGIDAVYYPHPTSNSKNPTIEFQVIHYDANYMLFLTEKVLQNKYLIWEAEYYKTAIEEEKEFDLRYLSSLSYCVYQDAYRNAYYRLGFEGDEIFPTYEYRCKEMIDSITYQKIRNCVEISHILNKEKIKEKRKCL